MSGKKSGISIDCRNRRSRKKSGIVPLARLFEPDFSQTLARLFFLLGWGSNMGRRYIVGENLRMEIVDRVQVKLTKACVRVSYGIGRDGVRYSRHADN